VSDLRIITVSSLSVQEMPKMPDQRTISLVDGLVSRVRDFIREEHVTYPEYHAALGYLLRLEQASETPLLAVTFLESTVDAVNHDSYTHVTGFVGSHHVPGAPWMERPYTLPMRPGEPGVPMLFHGRVESESGAPLAGATVDLWQTGADGLYSYPSGERPEEYLLRGRLRTDSTGEFDIRTIRPVPYSIADEGPVSDLLENVLGRHTWRPAHLHIMVEADGYAALNAQLYFPDDPYLDTDCLDAVTDSLILKLTEAGADGGPCRAEYVFRLVTVEPAP
jgi:catechol 1,2-dioxygenase